jgi:Txe/YoeB family toxin of Txe-Axe toxin-antitoxin module
MKHKKLKGGARDLRFLLLADTFHDFWAGASRGALGEDTYKKQIESLIKYKLLQYLNPAIAPNYAYTIRPIRQRGPRGISIVRYNYDFSNLATFSRLVTNALNQEAINQPNVIPPLPPIVNPGITVSEIENTTSNFILNPVWREWEYEGPNQPQFIRICKELLGILPQNNLPERIHLCCDVGAGIFGKLANNLDNVSLLITPQNIGDSANTNLAPIGRASQFFTPTNDVNKFISNANKYTTWDSGYRIIYSTPPTQQVSNQINILQDGNAVEEGHQYINQNNIFNFNYNIIIPGSGVFTKNFIDISQGPSLVQLLELYLVRILSKGPEIVKRIAAGGGNYTRKVTRGGVKYTPIEIERRRSSRVSRIPVRFTELRTLGTTQPRRRLGITPQIERTRQRVLARQRARTQRSRVVENILEQPATQPFIIKHLTKKLERTPISQLNISELLGEIDFNYNFLFDIKRAGDRDQVIAAKIAQDKGLNVIFVTNDELCAIQAITVGLPTVWYINSPSTIRYYRPDGSMQGFSGGSNNRTIKLPEHQETYEESLKYEPVTIVDFLNEICAMLASSVNSVVSTNFKELEILGCLYRILTSLDTIDKIDQTVIAELNINIENYNSLTRTKIELIKNSNNFNPKKLSEKVNQMINELSNKAFKMIDKIEKTKALIIKSDFSSRAEYILDYIKLKFFESKQNLLNNTESKDLYNNVLQILSNSKDNESNDGIIALSLLNTILEYSVGIKALSVSLLYFGNKQQFKDIPRLSETNIKKYLETITKLQREINESSNNRLTNIVNNSNSNSNSNKNKMSDIVYNSNNNNNSPKTSFKHGPNSSTRKRARDYRPSPKNNTLRKKYNEISSLFSGLKLANP